MGMGVRNTRLRYNLHNTFRSAKLMNLIDRYLGKTIIHTIAIVLFAMAGIEVFIMMIAELGNIGHGQYNILSAFFYVLLNLPDEVYQLFPMAGLVGMLMAFGLLASHSELIILQSAGMSPLKITLSALKTIIILLILVSLIGEVVAPEASQYANNMKLKLMNYNNGDLLAQDVWLRAKTDYLHVQTMDRQNVLYGVTWYHFDNQDNLLQASVAQQATYNNNQWLGSNVQQTTFTSMATTSSQAKQLVLPFTIPPNILLNNTQSPNDLSLRALHKSLKFGEGLTSGSQAVQLAFWKRLIQPISSLVMMLLAIPFIFGPLRNAANSLRLVIGIIVGFCFYYSNQFFGPLVLIFHWPPLLGALLPSVCFGVIGIALLRIKR